MTIEQAFAALQTAVNADPKIVDRARQRRNAFRGALEGDPDVDRTLASGSFARGTEIEPLKDVDLIVVYKHGEHPGWGQAGGSATEALEHLRGRVTDVLGPDNVDPDSNIEPVRFTQ